MKNKMLGAALAMAAFSITAANAADLPVKAPVAPVAAPVSPWDLAFGAAIMNDYVFRGITQSNHKPSVAAYFEPRYNINENLQLYVGLSGESISFANNAAAEVDFYAGIRPTFGKLAFDFGIWDYYYPGGRAFNGLDGAASCANLVDPGTGFCNVIKKNVSFYEVYGKTTYAITDAFTVGANVFYSPNFLNFGADGTYASGTAKYVGTGLPAGIGWYASGEFGRQWLGTTDAFYGTIKLPSYNTWNLGGGFTWKTFTLDLRYSDTNLSKADCNTITSDFTATDGQSKWCGATFIAKLSVDMTLANLK